MFFILRRMCPDVCRFTTVYKNNSHLPLLHNLKVSSTVDVKYHNSAKTALSLSNESMKKLIKYVIKEVEKGEPKIGYFLNEYISAKVARKIESRSIVEESMKSLEDLVKEDPEMRILGEEEYSSYVSELERLDEDILNVIFDNMGQDNCTDVILDITPGVGGQESMLFAKKLFDMYLSYLEYLSFDHEIIHQDVTPTQGIGGLRHASIAISGAKAMEILRHEAGVHRVQRIPVTERSGRMHTSTVTVAVLPQPSEIEVHIKEKDVKIETKNASGAGGQHVNTTDSAVRITHLPTGIIVESQVDRSQVRNRRIAMLQLRAKIFERQLNEQRESSGEMRRKQVGLGLRNEKIRTYNFSQDRITDHRINDGTTHNLKGFLEGGQVLEELQKKLQRDLQIKILQEFIRKALK